jgi:signal transduction histidine kinase
VTLHHALPLVACLLNIGLAAVAVVRNPWSRLNRLFVYFVATNVVWNAGVFMLRRSPDAATATWWEIIIHAGIILAPALFYHFAVVFLDSTAGHRVALAGGYALVVALSAINLGWPDLIMRGVVWTHWGWAPRAGPLYLALLVFFYAYFIAALLRLWRAYRRMDSSFRRNRTLLVVLGASTTILGAFFDFIRFMAARVFPAADGIYPLGIPANMVCALLLAISIVRYRMFDVDAAVKRTAVYIGAGALLTSGLGALTWSLERLVTAEERTAVYFVVPLGVIMTLLVSPVGRRLDAWLQRMIFSRRRGCYDTLLALSKRMSGILDLGRLVETLVHQLVERIPLTHAVLLTRDDDTGAFVLAGEAARTDVPGRVAALSRDSRLVEWLRRADGPLVVEELKVDPRSARHFDAAESELEDIRAAIVVPLKSEGSLAGILLLGEKLSGEIFDDHELDVLGVLATQAAISLQNARLYAELQASNVRLREASRLKSQFLASMSHELRTPLNSIIGFSKVLLHRSAGELNERQETYVRSVHQSSIHLLDVITDILDISRIEAGKLDMHREEVDLQAVLQECLEASASLVRGKAVRVEADVTDGLPRLEADRTKVKQVVLNMLSNAIKFTPAGRVVLRAWPEGDAVHVSVSDTGVGVAEQDLPRLFRPFERVENPLTRSAGGTGLGLAISKKFVEMHGGTIWAESREKVGSTFHFTLPATAAVTAPVTAPMTAPAAAVTA